MKCPQCKVKLEKMKFDVGYGVVIDSLHCNKCGFNVTGDKDLKSAVNHLRRQMRKEVKIVNVGTGLGLRFPNEVVKNYNLKKGEEIVLKPEQDGIKLVV
ncbi:hypothetical protein ACFLZX_04205 [Nanoarchaeota archaeon]